MRRADIINAVKNVQKAIRDSGVADVLKYNLRGSEKVDAASVIEASQEYSTYYKSFGENEKKIIEIFDLSNMESPKFWAQLLTDERESRMDKIYPYYGAINFMMENLDKIIELFKQSGIKYVEDEDKNVIVQSIQEGGEIITVVLPEKDNEFSSHPDRLIKVLNSISLFYKSLSIVMGHEGDDLSVMSIDSGSDKSFDFFGAAKVMTAVKELIVDLWDRVVFYREKKLHERMDLISKSIPLIENINQLEKEEKISKEQAEILRRNILSGVKDFLSAGAMLPDFTQYTNYNPRQLMAPEPKLLTMPSNVRNDTSAQVVSEDTDVEEDISAEDKDLIKSFLKEAKKKKK